MKICRGVFDRCSIGADHVRDLEVVIVDDARQVIEAGAVGPLDDVVLLVGPVERARRRGRGRESGTGPRAASSAARRPCGPRPRSAARRRRSRPSSCGCRGTPASPSRPPRARPSAPRSWRSRDRRSPLSSSRFDGGLIAAPAAATENTARTGRRPPGPSSQSRPSQRKPSRIGCSASATLRCCVGVVDPQQELPAVLAGRTAS